MDRTSRKGQSLIEALVALSILTIGLMGVLALLSRSFSLQRETADQAEATYLAAEGIEVTKSVIDHNVYTAVAQESEGVDEYAGWAGTIPGTCFGEVSIGSGHYYYDPDFGTYGCPPQAGSSAPAPLYATTDAQGVVRYYATAVPGSVESPFSRVVEVSRPDANRIDVVSTVTWSAGGFVNQSVVLEDTFYNWHP